MSRARMSPPDSLEMLLDTMCNMFGGIILIALLITVLTPVHESMPTPTETHQHQQGGPQTLTEVQQALSQAEAELRQLDAQLSDPDRVITRQLRERRDQIRIEARNLSALLESTIRTSQSKTESSIDQAVAQLTTLDTQIQSARRQLDEARRQDAILESRSAELQRSLRLRSSEQARLRDRQTQELRLPVEHESDRKPLLIVVAGGWIHPLRIPRDGQLTRNDATLDWNLEGNEVLEPRPKPGAGFTPEGFSASVLRALHTNAVYLAFLVRSNAFATFNQAKMEARSLGFEVAWSPLLDSEAVRISRFGTIAAPPVQQ